MFRMLGQRLTVCLNFLPRQCALHPMKIVASSVADTFFSFTHASSAMKMPRRLSWLVEGGQEFLDGLVNGLANTPRQCIRQCHLVDAKVKEHGKVASTLSPTVCSSMSFCPYSRFTLSFGYRS